MTDYDFEKLKEKHAEVMNNQAVQKIANWKDPLYHPDTNFSEARYLEKAKKNIQSLGKLIEKAIEIH